MNSENKTLILHMGLHKTGSTSIQDTFYYDHDKLEKYGIMYPLDIIPNHSNWMFNAFWNRNERHPNYWKWENRKEEHYESQNEAIKRFEETISQFISSDKSYLIISAEIIENFPENSLKHLVDTINNTALSINITPVVCLRNPVEWHNSLRQQALKKNRPPHDINPSEFSEKFGVFYSCFPKENIIVYTFEEAKKHKNGAVGCLFEKIGFDQKIVNELNLLRNNESVSDICIDIINYINYRNPLFIKNELSKTRKFKDVEPLFNIRGGKFKLKTSEFDQYLDEFRADVLFIKEKTGIDYMSYIDNYTKYTTDSEFYYPDTFAKDIEKVYFKLKKNIRRYVKNYIKLKLTEIKDPLSIQNLKAAYNTVAEMTKIQKCYKIIINEEIRYAKHIVKSILNKYD